MIKSFLMRYDSSISNPYCRTSFFSVCELMYKARAGSIHVCESDVESCGGILITAVYRDGPGASIGR